LGIAENEVQRGFVICAGCGERDGTNIQTSAARSAFILSNIRSDLAHHQLEALEFPRPIGSIKAISKATEESVKSLPCDSAAGTGARRRRIEAQPMLHWAHNMGTKQRTCRAGGVGFLCRWWGRPAEIAPATSGCSSNVA
jgi:hypothetical protein